MLHRRRFIQQSASFIAVAASLDWRESTPFTAPKRAFSIGGCDWSLGKNSDPAAFAIAKQIGLDGIMVDMGWEDNNLHLRDKAIQQQYRQAAAANNIKISSIALGVMNGVSYTTEPRTEQWVWDGIDVAKNLGASVLLLAFFSKSDLRNNDAGTKETIRRLKKVAPHAEKNGITLGIESYLNADEHRHIIESVGSKNLKVYYDFRNTADAGYDTAQEFKKLGKDLVCELHMKENADLLGKGSLDWNAIRDAVYESGYYGDGWMQIESSVPENANITDSFQHNLQFLRNLFSKPV